LLPGVATCSDRATTAPGIAQNSLFEQFSPLIRAQIPKWRLVTRMLGLPHQGIGKRGGDKVKALIDAAKEARKAQATAAASSPTAAAPEQATDS
jgi:hypothetical protein